MKNLFRRAAAAVVIAVLLLPSALAADPLGSRLYDYTLDICDGTTLTHQVLWGGSAASLRTENFVTYTPNPSVSPKVSFGATIPTVSTSSGNSALILFHSPSDSTPSTAILLCPAANKFRILIAVSPPTSTVGHFIPDKNRQISVFPLPFSPTNTKIFRPRFIL